MSLSDVPTITISQRTVSFLIGLITLASLLIGFVTVFNGYSFRVNQMEISIAELKSESDQLSEKMENLGDKIVSLTLTLSILEERNRLKR